MLKMRWNIALAGRGQLPVDIKIVGTGLPPSIQPSKRIPQTGYTGYAFHKYGITRDLVLYEAERLLLTDKHMTNMLNAVSSEMLTGTITLSDLRSEFVNLGKYVNITNRSGTFGLENVNILVSNVSYNFVERLTKLQLTTDQSSFTLGLG